MELQNSCIHSFLDQGLKGLNEAKLLYFSKYKQIDVRLVACWYKKKKNPCKIKKTKKQLDLKKKISYMHFGFKPKYR